MNPTSLHPDLLTELYTDYYIMMTSSLFQLGTLESITLNFLLITLLMATIVQVS